MGEERMRLAVLLVVLLCGCASSGDKVGMIAPGMTRAQVSAIMGKPPADQSAYGILQAWQYCLLKPGGDEEVVIWFRDGAVRAVTSRKEFAGQSCLYGLHEIDWNKIPADAAAALGRD
jgi:hypothetical protein